MEKKWSACNPGLTRVTVNGSFRVSSRPWFEKPNSEAGGVEPTGKLSNPEASEEAIWRRFTSLHERLPNPTSHTEMRRKQPGHGHCGSKKPKKGKESNGLQIHTKEKEQEQEQEQEKEKEEKEKEKEK